MPRPIVTLVVAALCGCVGTLLLIALTVGWGSEPADRPDPAAPYARCQGLQLDDRLACVTTVAREQVGP